MAVTVTRTNADNAGRTSDKHEAANDANVKDGHLHVTKIDGSGFSQVVAIYAPGKWQSVVVGAAAQ